MAVLDLIFLLENVDTNDDGDDRFDLDFQQFLTMGHINNDNDKKQPSTNQFNGNNNDACVIS